MNSYPCRTLLILFMTILGASVAHAQDDRYRVEIIVLKHLNHNESAQEQAWLKDYSDALDFLTPETEPDPENAADEAAAELNEAAADPAAEIAEHAEPGAAETEPGVDPNAVVHIGEMSPAMEDAWRRLRLSGPFRPLQFLAWEQGRNEPFPVLRVHDLDAILVDDPFADLRLLVESGDTLSEVPNGYAATPGSSGPARNTPAPPPQSFQYQTIDPDKLSVEASSEDAEPAGETLPDPTFFYALDGTASLVRTRFLHLYLDLELREAVFDTAATLRPPPTERLAQPTAEGLEQAAPTGFLVHSLRQNRQVRTGRMEYFDGPVIAVLAYITAVPLVTDEAD